MRALFAILLMAQAAIAGNLEFTFPPDWMDLSAKGSRAGLPPEVDKALARLRDPIYRLAAIDIEAARNGSLALVLASVEPLAEPVTREALVRAEPGFQKAMVAGVQGASCQLVSLDMTSIRDVPCGRLIYSLQGPGQQFRALMYLMPSGNELGGIVFLCDPNVFEARVGFFDAVAQSTKGVRPFNPAEVAPRQTSSARGDLAEFLSYMFLAVAIGYGVRTMLPDSKKPSAGDAGS